MGKGVDSMDGLSLGVAEVDVEHQLQIQLVASIRAAVAMHRDRPTVLALLAQLRDASDVHFGSEEIMMRLHAWQHYHQHVEEHRRLLEELETLRHDFEAGHLVELPVVLDQLEAWLVKHVRGPDRSFADHVARGGLGRPPPATGA